LKHADKLVVEVRPSRKAALSSVVRHFLPWGLQINRLLKVLLVCAVMGLLPACQMLTTRLPASGDAEAAWLTRQNTLSGLAVWNLSGRIGIQTDKESWQASLRWNQRADGYDIKLSTPLGQEVLQLQGGAAGVIMHTAEGEDFAQDGESLIVKRLGWHLPVSGLRYWVLGVPDAQAPPVASADRELDGLGRLVRLRQSGWEIDFRRYVTVNNIELPDKIFLSNKQGAQLEVRLVMEQWEIVLQDRLGLLGTIPLAVAKEDRSEE
jgi:outer membrane lipoprotein LolB